MPIFKLFRGGGCRADTGFSIAARKGSWATLALLAGNVPEE